MTAPTLFGRRARLTILVPAPTPGDYTTVDAILVTVTGEGDPNTPGLRIQFKIKCTLEKEPNTCEIIVTNLNEASRKFLQTKGVKVTLEAGYAGSGITGIFTGDVRSVDHKREKADWHTILKCGDGTRSYQFARIDGSRGSFQPGTSAGAILQVLADAMGVPVGNTGAAAAALQSKIYYQGYSVTGSVKTALDTLLKSLGYTWSIQNNTLQILAPGQVLDTGLIPLISPTSGLIGSPEMGSPEKAGSDKPALCKFQSLLVAVQPGQKVHLQSERYNNDFVVNKCEFDGDTHGGAWTTTIFGLMQGVAP